MTTQNDASIGIKKETTYGTAVTVDRWYEFLTESFDSKREWSGSAGLRVGSTVNRASRRVQTSDGAEGSLTLEVPTKGLGAILEGALGTVSTTLVETGVYQQVHTPATTDPIVSFTLQKGIPPIGGGATHAYTIPGATCKSVEFTAKAGSPVECASEWQGTKVRTDVAYTAPSYASGVELLSFVHGSVTIGGTITVPTTTALGSSNASAAANVLDISLKWENGIDEGGRSLGGAGAITRKPVLGRGKISGSMTIEYDSTTMRDAYLAGTNLGLVLTFTGPTLIGATAYPVLQVVVPVIVLTGELPKANGGGVVTTSVPFEGLDGSVASAPIYVTYRSTDTTP